MAELGVLQDEGGLRLLRMFTSDAAARTHAFRVHHHTEYELGLILSGEGRYLAGKDKAYEIRAGDVFFYKNSEPHCITDIAEPGMSLLNLHISPIYFKHLGVGEAGDFGIDFMQKTFPSNRLGDFLSPADMEAVEDALRQIAAEFTASAEAHAFMIQSCLNRALITLSRAALPTSARPSVHRSNTERIFGTAAYIDRHYTEPLTLSELAQSVSLEKTYFSALFKRVIGLSPCEYITVKRVERAVYLLKSTDDSVLDIAVACGFNNTANFNKLFKKYAGTVPKSIRRH